VFSEWQKINALSFSSLTFCRKGQESLRGKRIFQKISAAAKNCRPLNSLLRNCLDRLISLFLMLDGILVTAALSSKKEPLILGA
jgi:hypothetical protein